LNEVHNFGIKLKDLAKQYLIDEKNRTIYW